MTKYAVTKIIDCLDILAELGEPNKTTTQQDVAACNQKVWLNLKTLIVEAVDEPAPEDITPDLYAVINARVASLCSFVNNHDKHSLIIVECGVLVVALLEQLLNEYGQLCDAGGRTTEKCDEGMQSGVSAEEDAGSMIENKMAERCKNREREATMTTISGANLRHQKVVENSCRVLLHTVVLGCLDDQARLLPKMAVAARRCVVGGRLVDLTGGSGTFVLLEHCMTPLLALCKEELGRGLRTALAGEILAATLQLCFSPQLKKERGAEVVALHREALTALLTAFGTATALPALLLINGVAATANSGWLQRATTALYVRRYLLAGDMSEGGGGDGVRRVVRAGLDVCDGDDWRQCEAVASLVAQARLRDEEELYRIVGPQVVDILLSDECERSGSVLRVMSLVVSQLLERSASLTRKYFTTSLLAPLLALTAASTGTAGVNSATCYDADDALERCVAVVHRVVVLGSGGGTGTAEALVGLVVAPLVAVAAVAGPCRVASTARDCVVKYLSNMSSAEAAAITLLAAAGLRNGVVGLRNDGVTLFPPMREGVTLVISHDGGIIASHEGEHSTQQQTNIHLNSSGVDTSGKYNDIMEKDRLKAATVIKILCQLKNPAIVKALYHQLPHFLDFVSFSSAPVPSNLLLTLKDRADLRALRFRRLVLACEVLAVLTETEELTELMFSDMTDAVPLMRALLAAAGVEKEENKKGEQKKEQEEVEMGDVEELEDVRHMQESMILGIVVLISSYVGERSRRRSVTSAEWSALRSLLPHLSRVRKAPQTPAATVVFIEQLERTLLTHGAVGRESTVESSGDTTGRRSAASGDSSDSCSDGGPRSAADNETQRNVHNEKDTEKGSADNTASTMSKELIREVTSVATNNSYDIKEHSITETTERKNLITEIPSINDNNDEIKNVYVENIDNRQKEKITDEDDDNDLILDDRFPASSSVYNPKFCEDTSTLSPDLEKCKIDSEPQKTIDSSIQSTEGNKSQNTSGYVPISSSSHESTITTNSNMSSINPLHHPSPNISPCLKDIDYDSAMSDVWSPHAAIRGGSLLALTRLADRRDAHTMKHSDRLVAVFEHSLKDEDSYVYLMAVEGLAVMCEAMPEKVVPVVCATVGNVGRAVEERVKAAEAAVRAARRLAGALPAYKQHFLNALLAGVRDKDALVRAACLSGLGDVCQQLRFSVGAVAGEILRAVAAVVATDECCEPRRAAVLLVTLLLRGLGTDAIQVLRDLLRDLYRALKLIAERDRDDVMRTHAMLALDELDILTRAFLTGSKHASMTKHIYVMQPPPQSFF